MNPPAFSPSPSRTRALSLFLDAEKCSHIDGRGALINFQQAAKPKPTPAPAPAPAPATSPAPAPTPSPEPADKYGREPEVEAQVPVPASVIVYT